ncbi:S8 family serine peptidase [Hyphobacterium sp.]|uniref:S8 family serine peptidase n=1 Tax=Hyphobacterium sp. TaxID=2004662 RepID=UPI003BAC07D8
MLRLVLLMAIWLAAAPAFAQLSLPDRLPVQLPDTPLREPERLLDRLDDRVLGEIEAARRDALGTLQRVNRDLLETLPGGDVALRGEVLAVDPSIALLGSAQAAGFTIIEDRTEPALNLRYVRLRAPSGIGTLGAVGLLQQFDPGGLFDVNPLYATSGVAMTGLAVQAAPRQSQVRVGMIDAGVPDTGFPDGQLVTRHFRGSQVTPHEHGLQVAAILASADGAAPGARVYAADVYGGEPTGGSADTILRALGWMAERDVRVVNISIVGPRNVALRAAIERFTAQGRIVVAAVGNDGANARPLYPAAYPQVVAVTAIDAGARILPEAVQGEHVDFAARGMDMVWPSLNGRRVQVRGTSFAAPIVAGLLANEVASGRTARDAEAALTAAARDLGRRGRDDVYGHGAVGDAMFRSRRADLRRR